MSMGWWYHIVQNTQNCFRLAYSIRISDDTILEAECHVCNCHTWQRT
jgi:hypothetical protein